MIIQKNPPLDFTNCYTHGQLKYDIIKQIDPNGAKEIEKYSLKDFIFIRPTYDLNRNYFTSMEIRLDKVEKEFQSRFDQPTIRYFYRDIDDYKDYHNNTFDEVKYWKQ